ncbi:AI-2E family transporter [Bremerella cremea]|uniref:AI-2E family transporter n=1 Tax=Bremerella cremea TaxID=1031537 RepID=UPI0031EA5C63
MSHFARIEREMRGQTICLAIGVGCLALWSLYWLSAVLIPFVLAIFIVSGLTPLLSSIESRLSASRLVAVLIASLLGFGLVVVLWSIVWVSVAELKEDAPKYVQGAQAWSDWIPGWIRNPDEMFEGLSFNSKAEDPPAEIADAATPVAGSLDQQTGKNHYFSQLFDNVIKAKLDEIAASLGYVFQTGTMVVIFVFFLLLGSSQASLPMETWKEIDSKIREYIITKSLISFFTALAFGFVLWIFGIPLAAVFALLAFLFNFIPNIGPIIACLLPIPLILFDPDLAVWKMVTVTFLASTVQVVSGNVIEPRMMGESFDVHPIAVLLALMFWSLIWGMIGMFLAVPMTAVMKILFAKFEMTKPLADLLAGRIDGLSFKNFSFSASMDKGEEGEGKKA